MNEINILIWPSPDGAGMINSDAWSQTVDVATSSGDLEAAPDSGAYTNEYVEAALDILKGKGVQTFGSGWQPKSITLNEGGE